MTEPRINIQPRPAAALVVARPRRTGSGLVFKDGHTVWHEQVAWRLVPVQVVDFYAAAQDASQARQGL